MTTGASISETVVTLAVAAGTIAFPVAILFLAYFAYRGGFSRRRV